MKNLTINVVALCSLLLTAGVALGQDAEARIVGVVNPAQRIGIQIGDVIERKVMLDVKSPYQLSPNALPQKGLNRNGIELSAITLDATKRGELTAYTLLLRYQVFADVSTPVVLQTPAEEFALTGGPHALSIKLPEWRFWFSPLVATELRQVAANMQPQYPPPLLDIVSHRQRLLACLALFFVGIAGLIYLHVDGLPFMNGVFSQAYRRLRRLSPTEEKTALFYLHQAFNRRHGANLFARDIPLFLQAHPEFSRMQPAIEAFFAQSNQALFANMPQQGDLQLLVALAKSLRDCERGAA